MTDQQFKLGTFARAEAASFAGMVLGSRVLEIAPAYEGWRAAERGPALSEPATIMGLLNEWDRAFPVLVEIAAFARREGLDGGRLTEHLHDEALLRPLAPVQRPGKMLYAAGNFRDHVKEMRDSKFAGAFDEKRDFMGEKARAEPYLFLKASSCLAGANDDIVIPRLWRKLDWEAEVALAIGRPGRHIKAERATEHIAGFMTTNDVSCRDLTFRPDRQTLKSDWLGGKCFDTFAPMGPYLVPRQFAGNHHDLAIRLWVNGEIKQNGSTSQIIFNAEEQIEYASRITTLEAGDIFATGTCGGVGQGTNTFLKPGDVVETEVEGLGRQHNLVVEEPPEVP